MTDAPASEMIAIAVNGEPQQVPDGSTVADLLAQLGISMERVAVERNRTLVRRAEQALCRLESGDRLEIVGFVGGG